MLLTLTCAVSSDKVFIQTSLKLKKIKYRKSSFIKMNNFPNCLKLVKNHSKKICCLYDEIFSWLPLASMIDDKTFVVHGGIVRTN